MHARGGRPRRAHPQACGAALRRAAAARGHCACPGRRAGDGAGGRAHRVARQGLGSRGGRPHAVTGAGAGHDDPARHARQPHPRRCRPHPAPRRRQARHLHRRRHRQYAADDAPAGPTPTGSTSSSWSTRWTRRRFAARCRSSRSSRRSFSRRPRSRATRPTRACWSSRCESLRVGSANCSMRSAHRCSWWTVSASSSCCASRRTCPKGITCASRWGAASRARLRVGEVVRVDDAYSDPRFNQAVDAEPDSVRAPCCACPCRTAVARCSR